MLGVRRIQVRVRACCVAEDNVVTQERSRLWRLTAVEHTHEMKSVGDERVPSVNGNFKRK